MNFVSQILFFYKLCAKEADILVYYTSYSYMHLAWNDRRTRQFITNIGLITSDGPAGLDIMAAEWTHHISYSPSLIAINVRGQHRIFNLQENLVLT